MSEARSPLRPHADDAPMLERVEGAHRGLREVLDRLAAAADVETIAAGLRDLPTTLREHFAEEEAPGGLYDGLRHRKPAVETDLARLRADHALLGEQVGSLIAKAAEAAPAGAADPGDALQRLRAATASFVDALRRHERLESRLVSEIYYAEDGASG